MHIVQCTLHNALGLDILYPCSLASIASSLVQVLEKRSLGDGMPEVKACCDEQGESFFRDIGCARRNALYTISPGKLVRQPAVVHRSTHVAQGLLG